jgi:PAS domain S-box-containing protein
MGSGPDAFSRLTRFAKQAFAHAAVRYLFALAMVATAFGLRLLFSPWTGRGAPFVLFFTATLLTSLVAGIGPSLVVLLTSLPIAAVAFAIPAGATVHQAMFQALLYCIGGLIIIYLTHLTQRAQRRLQQSEEQFRLIFDEAPIGIGLVELDGRVARANRALCEILGHTAEELEQLSFQEITPAEDPSDGTRRDRVSRGGDARYQLEKRHVRKDGTTITISVSGSIVRGSDGRPLHYVAQIEDVTERKLAEQAVRKSELKFRRLVECTPDGVFINQAGRIVYANRGFGVLLGYDDEHALLGRPFEELVSPAALDLVKARIRLVLETGAIAPPREVTLIRRDGSPLVIESVAIGVEFEGAPAVVVVVRDLTERLRAEQAVRFSEAKLSGIVSISADAIISIDEHQMITIFNAGAEKIFGYSRDEVLGAPLDLLIPERLRQRHNQHVAEFAAGERTARLMGEHLSAITGRRKNGEEFPVEASISNLKVGETKLLTVVLRDVSERERLEKDQRILAQVGVVLAATLDYERTLAAVAQIAVRDFADWCMVEVMESSNDLHRLKVASADPGKTAVADALERIQLDRELPYLTRSVVESRLPLLASRFSDDQLEAVAQGPEHLQMLRAVRPVSVISVPLMLRDQLLGTLTFISSRPSRLYGPADLRLARAIADRASLAIENARLYRAALQATGARDQVLGVVAHDLRNPLNAISLQAAALKRSDGQLERRDPRQREAIERAARRMSRLIQDLLDVVVLEAGRLSVQRAPLSPRELVGEAAEMQQALASSSSIDLRVDVASDLPPIFGDRDRLLQVLENLIGNALKFTEPGGQVTVGATREQSGANFWIADTGRGLTGEEMARVFDPFWQASARSGRLGAGLGLPITKGIVEAHGGRIWVESAPGRGSTFFFSIPLAPSLASRGG